VHLIDRADRAIAAAVGKLVDGGAVLFGWTCAHVAWACLAGATGAGMWEWAASSSPVALTSTCVLAVMYIFDLRRTFARSRRVASAGDADIGMDVAQRIHQLQRCVFLVAGAVVVATSPAGRAAAVRFWLYALMLYVMWVELPPGRRATVPQAVRRARAKLTSSIHPRTAAAS
jgi:hypothetical protein